MIEKKQLRQWMKDQLAQLTNMQYEQWSYEISNRLFDQAEWKDAKMIGITISNRPEVDTYQIIRRAWREGKKVAVPKCFPKENIMKFFQLNTFLQLEKVFRDLYEPKLEASLFVSPENIDYLIVPGLAFTKEGYRLGFGGGYYDRYLPHFQGRTVSLAFDIQVVEQIPFEQHDLPVEKIITNKEVILSNE